MMDKKLNIGFITTVSGRWPLELPNARHQRYAQWLSEEFASVHLVKPRAITVSIQDVDQAIDLFRREAVDLLVVLIGAFSDDRAVTRLAEYLNLPVLLWALPEPPFDGGRLISNALVAATMNNAALKRLGHKVYFVYGDVDESRLQSEISQVTRVHLAAKCLRQTHLGLIGYRPTGFYSSTFDETLLRTKFGVSLEEFDLSMVFKMAEEIDPQVVEADIEGYSASQEIGELPPGYLENHSRLYIAMRELIEGHNFDAIALKCWPEMGHNQSTPCAMISRFADDRFIIGCESDVEATVTMLMQQYLAEDQVFMCDLIDIDRDANTALFWHCGQAGLDLHADRDQVAIMNHSLAGEGVVVEGVLKPGPVTVAKLSQIGEDYKLFLLRGQALDTDKFVRGAIVNVEMEQPVLDIVYGIATHGVPHHYSIVWEDIYDDLLALCDVLDIEVIEIDKR